MSSRGVAVVTGGASGIGEACCRELAKQGYRIAVLDRDLERAEQVAGSLGGWALATDVGEEADVERAAGWVESELGPVEALVNSAGVIQKPVRPSDLPMATWDDIVRINQRGTYVACRAFGIRMVERRSGSIVNIASISGMRSMPLHAYSPSKAAVIALTENLAAEWGPSGVRVNAVSPGYTATPPVQRAMEQGERDASALARNAALQRMVTPEEVASVVAFLASSGASAVTGANIPVDCGCLVAMSWNPYGGLRTPQASSD